MGAKGRKWWGDQCQGRRGKGRDKEDEEQREQTETSTESLPEPGRGQRWEVGQRREMVDNENK